MKLKQDLRVAFPISSVWFGALVGPSMVSGVYAAVYFAPYGAWGVALSYFSMIGICLVVALAANIVRKNKTYDYASFASVIYGKLNKFLLPLLDLFMILAMVVGGSAVISMSGTLLSGLTGLPAIVGALIMAAAGILLDLWGAKIVRFSSTVMTPILIGGFLLLTGLGIFSRTEQLGAVLSNWSTAGISLGSGVWGAILLGFSNLGMVTSLCSVEQKVQTASQGVWVAVCSLLLNGTAFALTTLLLLPYCPEVLSAGVPTTYIIDNFIGANHPWIGALYSIVMFFALLSSSAPQLHAVSARVLKFFPEAPSAKVKKTRRLAIGVVYMALCVGISFLGLFTIVSKGYSLLAKLGMPLIVLPIVIYCIRAIVRKKKGAAEPAQAEAALDEKELAHADE